MIIRRNVAVIGAVGLTAAALVSLSAVAVKRSAASQTPVAEDFTTTVVAGGFDTPWDMEWGSDSMIWISERPGRIQRLDPRTGSHTLAGVVPGVVQSGEGGLLGIALHPDFAHQPFVYAVHTYDARGMARNKLVRMRWDGTKLGPPETLLEGLQGGGIHNGSRIAVGRDGYLYISVGDGGWS